MDMDAMQARLESIEADVAELGQVQANFGLIGEALDIIRAMLGDVVRALGVDAAEYAEDLDRLDAVAHLVR